MSSPKTPIVMESTVGIQGRAHSRETYCTWVTHSRRIGPRMEMAVEQMLASLRGQSRVKYPENCQHMGWSCFGLT